MPNKLSGRVQKLVESRRQNVYERLDLELDELSDAELEMVASGRIDTTLLTQHPGLARVFEEIRGLPRPDGCVDDQRLAEFMARVDFMLCSDAELEHLRHDVYTEELLIRIERRIAASREASHRVVTDDDGDRWIECRGPTGAVIALPDNGREPSPESGVSAGVKP